MRYIQPTTITFVSGSYPLITDQSITTGTRDIFMEKKNKQFSIRTVLYLNYLKKNKKKILKFDFLTFVSLFSNYRYRYVTFMNQSKLLHFISFFILSRSLISPMSTNRARGSLV